MWIIPPSIRSAYALASGCSTKDSTPDLDTWASEAARSCTLNGKPTPSPSWKRAWKKEAYLRRLSGSAISPNSRQASFAAWWIASLQDSRARIYPSPESAPDSTASAAAYSSKSSASQPIAARGSCFWRTSQASLLPPQPLWIKLPPPKLPDNATDQQVMQWENRMMLCSKEQPPASWENWPTSGGTRNGSLYQRPTWEPATAGRGGSASRGEWMTPNVPNGGRHVPPELVASKGMTEDGQKRTVGQAASWPTPDAHARERTNRSQSPGAAIRPTIALAAAQWPTPATRDHHAQGATHNTASKSDSLATVAQHKWPTPASRDHKGANSAEHALVTGGGRKHMDQLANFVAYSPLVQATRDGQTSSEITPNSPLRLNPLFAAWLMGWPSTWTIAEPHASNAQATELWRSKLRSQLSSLLGEQELRREAA